MKNTFMFIIVSILFAQNHAFADGHEVRNGGSSVVCYANDGTVASIELFDYWEMKRVYGGNGVDLGSESLSVEQKINLFTSRLAVVDPYRSQRYKDAAKVILSQLNQILRDDLGSTPIDDDHSAEQPNSPCKKELFAVQIRVPLPGQTRFMIRKGLYNSPFTTNTTRAGIILHEVIYRDAIERYQNNSDNARYYNYAVASNLNGVTSALESYQYLLAQVHLEYQNVYPIYTPTFGRVIYLDSQFNSGNLLYVQSIQNGNLDISWNGTARVVLDQSYVERLQLPTNAIAYATIQNNKRVKLNSNFHDPDDHMLIGFSKKGQISDAGIDGEIQLSTAYDRISCQYQVSLNENNQLKSCVLSKNYRQSYGSSIDFLMGTPIRFSDDSSFVESGTLATPTKLHPSGSTQEFYFRGDASFDREGAVISGTFQQPIEFVLLGMKVLVSEFENAKGGTAYTYLKQTFQQPTFMGKSILNKRDAESKFCLSQGYMKNTAFSQMIRSEKKYITGQDYFYDANADKLILKTDEEVDVVQEIQCSGKVKFSIN